MMVAEVVKEDVLISRPKEERQNYQSGKIKAKSAGEIGQVTLETLNAVANGDYYPGTGVDGFDEVHIAVPTQTLPSASGVSFQKGDQALWQSQ